VNQPPLHHHQQKNQKPLKNQKTHQNQKLQWLQLIIHMPTHQMLHLLMIPAHQQKMSLRLKAPTKVKL